MTVMKRQHARTQTLHTIPTTSASGGFLQPSWMLFILVLFSLGCNPWPGVWEDKGESSTITISVFVSENRINGQFRQLGTQDSEDHCSILNYEGEIDPKDPNRADVTVANVFGGEFSLSEDGQELTSFFRIGGSDGTFNKISPSPEFLSCTDVAGVFRQEGEE